MPMTSIGDMSRLFVARRHNTQMKSQMNRLTQELSTGHVADLTAHLGRDSSRLGDIDRRLGLAQSLGRAATQTGQHLNMMQLSLSRIDSTRVALSSDLLAMTPASSRETRLAAGLAGSAAFSSAVGALNVRFGDNSLFGGTATDRPALAPADQMLDSLRIAVAGATTAAAVTTAVDAWFDTPGGGFETIGYLGDPAGRISRPIDSGQSVTLDARADDGPLRDILKATALTAMAADGTLALDDTAQATLFQVAGQRLLSAGDPLIGMQGRLGAIEQQVEEAIVNHAAKATAYGMIRNDMISADPYDTASALQEVQAQLETHYTLTARLSRLSLTAYLR